MHKVIPISNSFINREQRKFIEKYPKVKATEVFNRLPEKYWQGVKKRKSFWSKEKRLECQLKTKMEYIRDICEYTVKTEKIKKN